MPASKEFDFGPHNDETTQIVLAEELHDGDRIIELDFENLAQPPKLKTIKKVHWSGRGKGIFVVFEDHSCDDFDNHEAVLIMKRAQI